MALLEMRNISKEFGPVVANRDVTFSVEQGEVHALLGENGAGKSTLMNILFGMYEATEGDIYYKGEKVNIKSPKESIDLGIGMVHQHFMLIPAHTAIENVVLGYTGNKEVLDLNAAAERFTAMAKRYNMDIDPWEEVRNLSVGQQQRLEILKALYRDVDTLILDEPTAVLTPQEVDGLFDIIRQLISENKTVIFISHKLPEIKAICDRCTILRQGEVAAAGLIVDEIADMNELAELMVGRQVELISKKDASCPGDVVLKVDNISHVNERKIQTLKNVSFEVSCGEILGICGVDGNGQSELVKCITGLLEPTEGTIHIKDEDVTKASAKEILQKGVGHIPEDRQKMGMVGQMNIRENLSMMDYDHMPFSNHGILRWKWIDEHSREIVEQYQVKTPDVMEISRNLSGGNQQKMVVGRELSRDPELLIAVHPARGLDIGATKYIHSQIIKARTEGAAVLMVSTELDEIMEIPDRILVIYEGRVMAIIDQTDATRNDLGLLMAGIDPKNSANNKGQSA
ncbi:MAG: ABC transporter ATP-binding protein [Eubacteriales bacterium]|nr:ABC transporter ATP-binding protein [Eubacteriales bacterium]MDD4541200.1 ABC transporter ATP-binding protein [Eubacteriales bacterium]